MQIVKPCHQEPNADGWVGALSTVCYVATVDPNIARGVFEKLKTNYPMFREIEPINLLFQAVELFVEKQAESPERTM